MSHRCPECGAVLDEDRNCQEIFDSFLVLEYSDPGYGRVHMLTVACFMIQHGRYSDEGLIWIEQKLRDYLISSVPPDLIRQRAGKETGQSRRKWKVNRPPGARPLPRIAWSITIADVAANYRDVESYCRLIEQWARITLLEMKPHLRRPRAG